MNARHPVRRDQEGSAFVLALIVIMLLTILGLSVSVITETEMQLGSTEKTIDRQDYAAESGMWAMISGLVVTNRWSRQRLAIVEAAGTDYDIPGRTLGYAVESTSAKLLAQQCPPWTDCGEDLDDEDFLSFYVVTGATAQRVGFPTSWNTPFKDAGDDRFTYDGAVNVLGQSAVSFGFYLSPARPPGTVDIEIAVFETDGFKTAP